MFEGRGSRRDYEPYAADLLRWLGWAAVGCGILAFCCWGLTGPLGVASGLACWGLARRELRRLRAGRIDPGAEEAIRSAARDGQVGALVSAIRLAVWALLVWHMHR